MNKEEANKRLIAIEKETKELRAIINSKGKITDRVKSFEDAVKELGIKLESCFYEGSKDEVAFRKLKIIAEALNEGWVIEPFNTSQYKYYPYFSVENNGFVCCNYFNYCYWDCVTPLSLLFKSADLATYCGTQFTSLYKEYYGVK